MPAIISLPPDKLERMRSRLSPEAQGSSDCLLWEDALTEAGYGKFYAHAPYQTAHRAAFLIFVGSIPDGHELDHACHTRDESCPGGLGCLHRRCFNSGHLKPVTRAEHLALAHRPIGAWQTAKTHCPKNHPYDEANTLRTSQGRVCRTCKRDRAQQYLSASKGGISMTIYTNQPEVQLALPDDAPGRTLPRIRQIETGHSGARIYERATDDIDGYVDPAGGDLLFVTPGGHWYRADDQPDCREPMPCRGCRASGLDYAQLDEQGRCPRSASAQDIATALLAFLRPEPASMRSHQVRFIRTAVAA